MKRKYRRIFLPGVLCVLLTAAISVSAQAWDVEGKVVWIYDGDTISVATAKGKRKIRVYGIDCPEQGQPYAARALKYCISLCKYKTVKIHSRDTDRYGRLVGDVILPDGRSLAEEMIRAGLAWHYRRYSKSRVLAELEKNARAAKKGLWGDPRPVPPWEFKRKKSRWE